MTTAYRIRTVSASSEPLRKVLGVLYFRRLLLDDSVFADYQNALIGKYQKDFTKFAMLCAQISATSVFFEELKLFAKTCSHSGKYFFIASQVARYFIRLVKFKWAKKGTTHGV